MHPQHSDGYEIYFASTPRHLLIACAVALFRGTDNPKKLVIKEAFVDASIYLAIIESWGDSPFEQVKLLTHNATRHRLHGLKKFLHRFNKRPTQKKELDLLAGEPVRRIITSDLTDVPLWYFFHRCLELNGGVPEIEYIEDGLFSYVERRESPKPQSRFWRWRKLRGFPVSNEHFRVGTRPPLVRAWFINSELASLNYAACVEPVSRAWLVSDSIRRLSDEVLQVYGVSCNALSQLDVVVILDTLQVAKLHVPDFDADFSRFIRSQVNRGLNVAVKPHPRESQASKIFALLSEKVHYFDAGVPAEFLLGSFKDDVMIIGSASTVFVDMLKQKPNAQMKVLDSSLAEEGFESLFSQLGIKRVTTYE